MLRVLGTHSDVPEQKTYRRIIKVAKAIGIEMPSTLLARADEVTSEASEIGTSALARAPVVANAWNTASRLELTTSLAKLFHTWGACL
jgi:hypothetical protein